MCVCVRILWGHGCSNDLLNVKWTVVGRKHYASVLAGSSLAFHALIVRQLLKSAHSTEAAACPENWCPSITYTQPWSLKTPQLTAYMNTNKQTHTHWQRCDTIRSRWAWMDVNLNIFWVVVYLLRFCPLFRLAPFSPQLPPNAQLCHVTDSFWVEKGINHLRNNSFYESVPLIESILRSLGWASQLATAWCGLRGCHVCCLPPLKLISRVHRDFEERPMIGVPVA